MHRKSKSKIKKQNIKLASDFISARKTLSSNSFINPINIGRYYYQTITNYESKKNKNMKIYNEKKVLLFVAVSHGMAGQHSKGRGLPHAAVWVQNESSIQRRSADLL